VGLAHDAGVMLDEGSAVRDVALAINVDAPEDVDAALTEAEAAGGKLVKRPVTAEWGGYSGYFADPDGHLWEVAWNPGFPLGSDGRPTLP